MNIQNLKLKERLNTKKRWIVFFKMFFGIGMMALLIWKVGPKELSEKIRAFSPFYYLVALIMYAGGEAIRTVRWQRLLQVVGEDFRLGRLIKLHFIGKFFNQFLPTSVGGDGARIFYLCRHDVPWEKAAGSVLVERVVGMLMLLLVGVVAGAVGYTFYHDLQLLLVLVTFMLAFSLGVYLLFSERAVQSLIACIELLGLNQMRAGIEKFSQGIRVYRAYPRALLFVAVISLLFQLVVITLFYLCSLELKMGVPIGYFFLFVPIILSAANIPISLNGLGIRDGVCVFLFSRVGAESGQALALAMLYLLINLGEGLIGAAVFMFSNWQESRGQKSEGRSQRAEFRKEETSNIERPTSNVQQKTEPNS